MENITYLNVFLLICSPRIFDQRYLLKFLLSIFAILGHTRMTAADTRAWHEAEFVEY